MRGDILIDTNIQRNGILHKEMVCAGIDTGPLFEGGMIYELL